MTVLQLQLDMHTLNMARVTLIVALKCSMWNRSDKLC